MKTLQLPPLELLQDLFEVSAASPSGLLWRRTRSNRIQPGSIAGTKMSHGYWQVNVKTGNSTCCRNRYLAHRIVYFLQTGEDPGTSPIDHVNGIQDPLTLRLATIQKNNCNTNKKQAINGKPCSSNHKGVCWAKYCEKWRAYIDFEGKRIHLGYFESEILAATAYNRAATKYHGEYASLNELKN